MFRRIFLPLCLLLVCGLSPATAQESLPDERWFRLETDNFVLISRLSAGRTTRLAQDLEWWRQAASRLISGGQALPAAPVPNLVYVFADEEEFSTFAQAGEAGMFFPTPRGNFMAMVAGDDNSLHQARHHYTHFLVRNFIDLRIPRWYEEGLAGYLDSLIINNGRVELARYREQDLRVSAQLSREVSLEEMLYDEQALASPRLIQIANLKAETFLHFLWHGPEEDGFPDRRAQLQAYLDLVLSGRTQRFAFDQSFDISPRSLDLEYERWLQESGRPQSRPAVEPLAQLPEYAATTMGRAEVAVALGELALNAGHFARAGEYFRQALAQSPSPARASSGYADSQRMQELPETTTDLRNYYEAAAAQAGEQLEILLDYGEYLETLVEDCDQPLTGDNLRDVMAQVHHYFSRTVAINPAHPEANLAMAQFYLFPGQRLEDGIPYQRRAQAALPADTFVMEQAVKYAIEEQRYQDAERLLDELSQPLHLWGEPDWVSELRRRLTLRQQGLPYDECDA